MMRQSTAAGAMNVAVFVTSSNGVAFQRRTTAGGQTGSTVVSGVGAPVWVRLARRSDTFAGYYSVDGVNWTQIGASTVVSMATTALAGMAVTAHNNTTSCAATLDNVSVNQAPVLAPIANQTILAGRTLLLTNSASDVDIPSQTLRFSMAAAPPGAFIDPNSGVFVWRPAIAQSPSSQAISVVVSDSGVPNLTVTQSFIASVTRPVSPLLSASLSSSGTFQFAVTGDMGPDYTVLSSTNLVDWIPLWSTNSPPLPFEWTDLNFADLSNRFYRIELGP
jgi:hypothetical protein